MDEIQTAFDILKSVNVEVDDSSIELREQERLLSPVGSCGGCLFLSITEAQETMMTESSRGWQEIFQSCSVKH